MFCPHCGNRVGAEDTFCGICGAPQPAGSPEEPERLLFFFGPFGVSVCDGSYSPWKWHKRNDTTVELTNRRILGMPRSRRGLEKIGTGEVHPVFDIPYRSLISVQLRRHPSPVAFQDILTLRYREGEAVREKSICMFRHELQEAVGLMRQFAPPELELSAGDEV